MRRWRALYASAEVAVLSERCVHRGRTLVEVRERVVRPVKDIMALREAMTKLR